MNNKIKKILLVVILIIIVIAIIFVGINSSSGKKEKKNSNLNNGKLSSEQNIIKQDENKIDNNLINNEIEKSDVNNKVDNTEKSNDTKKEVTIEEVETGTKYIIDNSIKKADIIVGDNYYDTQISDINLNFNNYSGKTIEIEGLYFENLPYMFVGRYSTSNLCPYCPTGYSYFEFEWNGDKKIDLKDSKSWIKIIGTLKEGKDEDGPYYYIEASSVEVKKEQGILTVSN